MKIEIWRRVVVKILIAFLTGVAVVASATVIGLFFSWLQKSVYWGPFSVVVLAIVSIFIPVLMFATVVQAYREAEKECEREYNADL